MKSEYKYLIYIINISNIRTKVQYLFPLCFTINVVHALSDFERDSSAQLNYKKKQININLIYAILYVKWRLIHEQTSQRVPEREQAVVS